ncbi:CHAP domain-containing protein [Candidatus Saccharibacteria bacterium CPR2]|nr:CHAP domain-containing protein [Candidatus Saccharibacteria bacterium CPR2]
MPNPESTQQTEILQEKTIEQETDNLRFKRIKSLIGKVALSLTLVTGAGIGAVAEEVVNPQPAEATEFVNDYPNLNASPYNPSAYEWWVDENGNGHPDVNNELISPRNYYYRNCTDGAAYWTAKYTGVNVTGWGNAVNWDNAATAYTVKPGNSNSIEPGDIAQSDDDGYYGHVGFVANVAKDASGNITAVNVAELNKVGTGEYSYSTYTSKNASGKFTRGGTKDWDHFIDVNGAGKGLNGDVLGGGNNGGSGGNGNGGGSNGIDTIGVYNPNIATFDLRNSNTTGIHDVTLAYGNIGAVALTGDWNGDGIDTIGVYNPSLATFDLRNSNTTGNHDITLAYGNIGAKPLVGDWNGDGIDTIGVYNPTLGTFDLRNSNTTGNHDITLAYGNIGAIPLVGDWNGDGIDTIGVYNPSLATFDLRNSNTTGIHDITLAYGNIGAIPVVGDWNGDGIDTIGVYNPTLGTFDLRNSNTTGNHDITLAYGNIGAKPIIGDWNGQ